MKQENHFDKRTEKVIVDSTQDLEKALKEKIGTIVLLGDLAKAEREKFEKIRLNDVTELMKNIVYIETPIVSQPLISVLKTYYAFYSIIEDDGDTITISRK